MSIYEYPPAFVFFVVLAALLGLVFGSFLNCAAYRVVRGESFVKGRSHCPSCGHELGALELIPLVSWALQKGKCKWCGSKVSVRYPLTEAFFAVLTVLCLLRFDLTVLCLRNYVFLCCLFLLTLTDLEDMTIPDGCLLAAAGAWVFTKPFLFSGWPDVWLSLLAGLVYGGGLLGISLLMDKIMGRDTMGGGDIKLIAVVGLYLGFVGTLFCVVFACVAGLVYSALRKGRDGSRAREGKAELTEGEGRKTQEKRREEKETEEKQSEEELDEGKAFPFGPFIAASAAFMLLYGYPLVSWYMGLLGLA